MMGVMEAVGYTVWGECSGQIDAQDSFKKHIYRIIMNHTKIFQEISTLLDLEIK